ncbi:MAG: fused MFS/spermidine synthase [Pseudomonadota bacterium]
MSDHEATHPQSGPHTLFRSVTMLIIVQVLVAAAGLVVEIVAGRMLAPYVGMSLYTWTAVIAVVLAGFSFGHWAGGHIAQKPTEDALAHTALAMALAALTTALTLVLLRWFAQGVISGVTNAGAAILILASIIAFLPSFFAGVPAPVLARTLVDLEPGKEGIVLGAVFAAGSFGAIAGTLAAGFLFISWLGTALTILVVVLIYMALAGALHLAAGTVRHRWAMAILSGAALALSVYNLNAAEVCTKESRYYCIRIIDFSSQVDAEAKLMVLDHLGHGINVKEAPERLVTPYVALMDRVLTLRLGAPPKSSFFIGGGAYTLPRAWQAASPGATITVAEVDPAVTELARRDMWFETERVQIVHADARVALGRLDQRFEVIVGDAFTDIAVPSHLVTREFFTLVRRRLQPGGVYAMNVVDHAEQLDALMAVHHTLKAVFPDVEIFAEEGDIASGGRTTFVLFASEKPSGLTHADDPREDGRRFVRLSPRRLAARAAQKTSTLLTDDFAPIDRLVGIGKL